MIKVNSLILSFKDNEQSHNKDTFLQINKIKISPNRIEKPDNHPKHIYILGSSMKTTSSDVLK